MADDATPNFDFVLPEVGASPDTWGNKLNANWTDVDGLLAGRSTGYSTAAIVATVNVSVTVDSFATDGFAIAGDGGHGLYKRVGSAPAHAAFLTSLDGAFFELVPFSGVLNIKQVGGDFDDALSGWSSDWTTINLDDVVVTLTASAVKTIVADVKLVATSGGGFLASAPSGLASGLLVDIIAGGNNVFISDIKFDGNSEVPELLRIHNTVGNDSRVSITGSTFVDARRRLAEDGVGSADAVQIRGGFESVIFDDNLIKNIIREAGTGIPGSQGTTGLSVSQETGTQLYPRAFYAKHNTIDTIDTEDVGDDRVDCDGIKYFNGEATEYTDRDTKFLDHACVIDSNMFTDCAGRAVKIQSTNAKITRNTIVRKGVLAISGGFIDINLQMGSGTVRDNTMVYFDVGGLNPFTSDGSVGTGSSCIGFFHTPISGRPAGIPIITGNTIYNNVPTSLGVLNNIIALTRSTADPTFAFNPTVRDNKMIGADAACEVFVTLPVALDGDAIVYPLIQGNDGDIQIGFTDLNASNPIQTVTTAGGNVNGTGVEIPFTSNRGAASEARHEVWSSGPNRGVQTTPKGLSSVDGERSAAVLRTQSVFPSIAGVTSGGFHVWSNTMDDDATEVLPEMGYNGTGLYLLGTNSNDNTRSIFSMTGTASTDFTGNGATLVSLGNGVNPNVDGNVNIWLTGGAINIQNRLGSSRVITLVCVG